MPVQSIIFNKKLWTITKARAWLKAHKYNYRVAVDTTVNFHRFRQLEPTFKRHRTEVKPGGIEFIIGF